MGEFQRNQAIVGGIVRKFRLGLGAALVSAVVAACGGGSDSPTVEIRSNDVSPAATADVPAASLPSAPATPSESPPAAGSSDTAATSDERIPARVASAPGATTLSWTPPTTTEEGAPLKLKGYRIYWGPTEGYYPYSVTLSNPGLTRYVVEELAPATWYFVATALSEHGESEFSNAIAMKVL